MMVTIQIDDQQQTTTTTTNKHHNNTNNFQLEFPETVVVDLFYIFATIL
jgi:hypothetical protein